MSFNALPDSTPWDEALVMMVDDESLLTDVIQTHLEDAGYTRFVPCNEPRDALALIRQHRPDILLLDLMMPIVSGFDILQALRADAELQFTPVIVLTAASDAATKLRALEVGATEFLAKPVDASELVLRVRNTLAFKRYQDRLASIDALTGLPNRERFTSRLDKLLSQAIDHNDTELGLLHIGSDQFRRTRETLGPRAADTLLRLAAERLVETMGLSASGLQAESLNLSRVGDQAFALMLPSLAKAEAAAQAAKQCLQALSPPIEVDGHPIFLTPGIGIALGPADATQADELLKRAELACAKAIDAGSGSHYEFFSEELTARSLERLTITHQLRRALEREELRLHYQPKISLRDGRIVGAEALVRWQHPEHGLLLPGRFIGIAEESGLIGDIGQWVLQEACAQAARWRRHGVEALKVSINVARPQFDDGRLCQRLSQLLARHGLPPESLVLELTESMLVDDAAKALAQMDDLRQLGVGLSIDDFGTGYSSLSYLKRFPASELKIDRSFIIDLPRQDRDRAIVQTVITLGHSLGMEVVAEGIETPEQRRALQQMDCDVFQGFLFSKAVPPEEFDALLQANLAVRDSLDADAGEAASSTPGAHDAEPAFSATQST